MKSATTSGELDFWNRAYIWDEENGIKDLGSLADTSFAYDINNSGLIVGKTDVDGAYMAYHPCIFTNPGITDLGNFGSGTPTFSFPEDGEAVAVSFEGKIIGRTRDYEEGSYHGFVTSGSELSRMPYEYFYLDEPGTAYYSSARAISYGGCTIVGANYINADTGRTAYGSKWSYKPEPLFKPLNEAETEWSAPEGFDPSSNYSYIVVATSIDLRGVIVGYVESWLRPLESHSYRAFIIRYGEDPRWLDELLPCDTTWTLQKANAISGRGYIVGQGRYKNKTRAFFMWPVSWP